MSFCMARRTPNVKKMAVNRWITPLDSGNAVNKNHQGEGDCQYDHWNIGFCSIQNGGN